MTKKKKISWVKVRDVVLCVIVIFWGILLEYLHYTHYIPKWENAAVADCVSYLIASYYGKYGGWITCFFALEWFFNEILENDSESASL